MKHEEPSEIKRRNLDAMPGALRELANQIESPDDVPAMCLRDAAELIESLRMAVADAVRRPMGVVPESASWMTAEEMDAAESRRVNQPRPTRVIP